MRIHTHQGIERARTITLLVEMGRHQSVGEVIAPNGVNDEELRDAALSSGGQYCTHVRIQPAIYCVSSALGSKKRRFVSK